LAARIVCKTLSAEAHIVSKANSLRKDLKRMLELACSKKFQKFRNADNI
jgi:hypothetical protein